MMLQPGAGRGELVGTAMNSQGRGARLAAPSEAALSDLLLKAARDAQLPLELLEAVELPTPQVLRHSVRHGEGRQAPVAVSCAQATWSHLGPVSGLLSLTRCLLSSSSNLYGPQLHLRQLVSEAGGDTRRAGGEAAWMV